MTIIAGDAILKYGPQASVVSGSTLAVASGAFANANADAGGSWTNAFDVDLASAVLELSFATMPTYGSIGLYAHTKNVVGVNDPPVPSLTYRDAFVGAFRISTDAALNGLTHYLPLSRFTIPALVEGQSIDWWIENADTDQTVSAGWNLYIGPFTYGPKA